MADRILASVVLVTAACLGVIAAGSAAAGPAASGSAASVPAAVGPNDGESGAATLAWNESTNATVQGVVVRNENGTVLLRALVRLNCSTLAVNATPEYRSYALRLAYVHEGTGERASMLAGPLNGTVTDPFGETPYDLRSVDLRFAGLTVLSVSPPDRCSPRRVGRPPIEPIHRHG